MKLIQDSEIFILTTYNYTCTYISYAETRYRLFEFIPESKRPVIRNKMQEKLKKAPLQRDTYGVFRCYKNMQLVLNSNLSAATTYIRVE